MDIFGVGEGCEIIALAIHLLPALAVALSPFVGVILGGWERQIWLAGIVSHIVVVVLDRPLRKASAPSTAPLLILAAWTGLLVIGFGI